MRIETKCKKCRKIISLWTWAEDRIQLAMEKGEFLDLTCKHCKKSNQYHVNDLRAEPNKYVLLIAFLIFLVGTPIIFYLIYEYLFKTSSVYSMYALVSIAGLPVAAYAIISKDMRAKRNAFNWIFLNEHN